MTEKSVHSDIYFSGMQLVLFDSFVKMIFFFHLLTTVKTLQWRLFENYKSAEFAKNFKVMRDKILISPKSIIFETKIASLFEKNLR